MLRLRFHEMVRRDLPRRRRGAYRAEGVDELRGDLEAFVTVWDGLVGGRCCARVETEVWLVAEERTEAARLRHRLGQRLDQAETDREQLVRRVAQLSAELRDADQRVAQLDRECDRLRG